MTAKPKILVVCDSRARDESLLARLGETFEIVVAESMLRALARLKRDDFAGVFVGSAHLQEAFQVGKLLQNETILRGHARRRRLARQR